MKYHPEIQDVYIGAKIRGYKRKEECCGCTACYAICPKEAISMVEDEEGFEYPQIDESKCVRCYQCIKVCPIKATRAH